MDEKRCLSRSSSGWLVCVGADLVQAPRIEGKQIILMSHCRSIISLLLLILPLLVNSLVSFVRSLLNPSLTELREPAARLVTLFNCVRALFPHEKMRNQNEYLQRT